MNLVKGTSIQKDLMNSAGNLIDLSNLINLSSFSPEKMNSLANNMIKDLISENLKTLISGSLSKISNIQSAKTEMENKIYKYNKMLKEFNV